MLFTRTLPPSLLTCTQMQRVHIHYGHGGAWVTLPSSNDFHSILEIVYLSIWAARGHHDST